MFSNSDVSDVRTCLSITSYYNLNSQLNSQTSSSLQTYLFMCLNCQIFVCFWLQNVYLDIGNLTLFLFSSSRKANSIKSRTNSESEPGWNLYIINTVSTIQLYREMVFPTPAFVYWLKIGTVSLWCWIYCNVSLMNSS